MKKYTANKPLKLEGETMFTSEIYNISDGSKPPAPFMSVYDVDFEVCRERAVAIVKLLEIIPSL